MKEAFNPEKHYDALYQKRLAEIKSKIRKAALAK
jgi:hypothetical protein